jgi:hypothetical protein
MCNHIELFLGKSFLEIWRLSLQNVGICRKMLPFWRTEIFISCSSRTFLSAISGFSGCLWQTQYIGLPMLLHYI